MPHDRVRVAVVGASGYSGIEAVRILAAHPFVEVAALTSEHYAGREVADVYRHMAGTDLPAFEELRPDLLRGRAEVVGQSLPEDAASFLESRIGHGAEHRRDAAARQAQAQQAQQDALALAKAQGTSTDQPKQPPTSAA